MLDVHPPHHPTHGWRDFFIHIATIVVGLLIAVALEQTVEILHHRHQVAETRAELARERELNRQRFLLIYRELDHFAHEFRGDADTLRYLQTHPHARPESWPHPFSFTGALIPYDESAWKTAQLSGVLTYMPHKEVKRYNELYLRMAAVTDAEEALREPVFRMRGAYIDGPLENQTAAQLQAHLDDLKALRIRVAVIVQMQHYILYRYHDFPSDNAFYLDRHLLLNEPVAAEAASPWQQSLDHLNAIDDADDNDR